MNPVDISQIEHQLQEVREQALARIRSISDLKALEDWRVEFLGKKSPLTQLSRQMGSFDAETRPMVGSLINQVRGELQQSFEDVKKAVEEQMLKDRFAKETIDVTLPGRRPVRGALHPITRTLQEIEDVFLGMGFEIADGPEVETDA